MAKKIQKNSTLKQGSKSNYHDDIFFLKIVLYLVLGMQWIRIVDTAQTTQYPIPVGLIIGFFFARSDHFMIDRKIEYAVLLIAMLVGFWTQMGIYVTL